MGDDGTSAVDFLKFGGLRLVEIAEVKSLNDFVTSTGARWADYVTSWNDPLCEQLLVQGWQPLRGWLPGINFRGSGSLLRRMCLRRPHGHFPIGTTDHNIPLCLSGAPR